MAEHQRPAVHQPSDPTSAGPYEPVEPLEPAGTPPRPAGRADRLLALVLAVAGVGLYLFTVRTGRADTGLLFVGLPTVLAVALALRPGRTSQGQILRATTIALLACSVLAQEGAICVVLAAPLVYAVVLGVAWAVRAGARRRRSLALLPLPLLALGSLEGTDPALRVVPVQTVIETRVLPLTSAEVAERLAAGPAPVPVEATVLRRLDVPMPVQVSGAGLDPGQEWTFRYDRPRPGVIRTRVVEAAEDHVDFAVVQDTSVNARWLHWRTARVTWRPVDAGHTEVGVRLEFERRLDPSWYFGPLQDALMHDGAEHLLDMLDLA